MNKPFWSDGIRFECQGTGRCCVSRDGYGYVYMTLDDRRRMARVLGLSTSAFTRKHCDQTDGHFHLKSVEGPCEFLEGKSCGVYEGRPAQCRTWPFWPENMNARTWNRDVKAFCPGVGKGRLYSAVEIEKLLKQDPIEG
jgi:hypothetical protein